MLLILNVQNYNYNIGWVKCLVSFSRDGLSFLSNVTGHTAVNISLLLLIPSVL